MRKLIVTVILSFPAILIGQNSSNYYVLRDQKMQYFRNLAELEVEEILFEEESGYNQFMEWDKYWEMKVYPDGDILSFLNTYYQGLENRAQQESERYPKCRLSGASRFISFN